MDIHERKIYFVMEILVVKMIDIKKKYFHVFLIKMLNYLTLMIVLSLFRNLKNLLLELLCGKKLASPILSLVKLHFVDQIKENTLIIILIKICFRKWDIGFVIRYLTSVILTKSRLKLFLKN